DYYKRYNLPDFLFVYGVGDHGGGPTIADIKRKQKMETKPVFPKLEFSTTHRYFKKIEKYKNKIPVVTGELNTIFEGCYTTHSDIKKANRISETLLLKLEALSSIIHMKGGASPEEEIEEFWRTVLFNQFHDIIDGSAIHSSYEYSGKLAEDVEEKARFLVKKMMEKLVSHKETGKVTVFNPVGWKRKFAIDGRFIIDVPGYGYKTITPKEEEIKGMIENKGEYENEFYKIAIDEKKGLIKKLYDKKNRCDVLFPCTSIPQDPSSWWAEKSGNLISVVWEEPHPMSAWIIGNIYRRENLLKADEIKKEMDNLKTTLYIKRTYRNSEIIQKIVLYNEFPFIDFENEINWKEEGNSKEGVPMLRVSFYTGLKNPEAYFEIPFGVIKREPCGKEYPALRWAGQKSGNYWVVLMNKEKYGYHIDGNNLSLTLLRNPYEPDALPDNGKHTISYRLFFGKVSLTDITKLAMEYNTPPIVISGKSEPEEFCPFEIKGNVVPTTFKKVLGRNSYILRVVEIEGKKQRVKIKFAKMPKKAYISNSIEKREREIKGLKGKILTLTIEPFQILSLDIQF
ncbi:MAG: glycosyl hydrolase-related protein, partial [Candidatus Omnitrophica bacterium]|nr:glycosyl hydrolase-related protein [Candidatus Omnitrophota bacterium]